MGNAVLCVSQAKQPPRPPHTFWKYCLRWPWALLRFSDPLGNPCFWGIQLDNHLKQGLPDFFCKGPDGLFSLWVISVTTIQLVMVMEKQPVLFHKGPGMMCSTYWDSRHLEALYTFTHFNLTWVEGPQGTERICKGAGSWWKSKTEFLWIILSSLRWPWRSCGRCICRGHWSHLERSWRTWYKPSSGRVYYCFFN